MNKPWIEWALLLAALLFGVTLAHCARADYEQNPFYRGKTVPGTPQVSCCNKKDCSPLTAWRQNIDGEYEIYLPYGYWYKPEQRIIREAFTPDGQAHACWTEDKSMTYGRQKITVFCVWIPIMFM